MPTVQFLLCVIPKVCLSLSLARLQRVEISFFPALCRAEIKLKPVASLNRGGTEHFAVMIYNFYKSFLYIAVCFAVGAAAHEKIKFRAAAHGTEVYHFFPRVPPRANVANICSTECMAELDI